VLTDGSGNTLTLDGAYTNANGAGTTATAGIGSFNVSANTTLVAQNMVTTFNLIKSAMIAAGGGFDMSVSQEANVLTFVQSSAGESGNTTIVGTLLSGDAMTDSAGNDVDFLLLLCTEYTLAHLIKQILLGRAMILLTFKSLQYGQNMSQKMHILSYQVLRNPYSQH
jgi:hypothetical protein